MKLSFLGRQSGMRRLLAGVGLMLTACVCNADVQLMHTMRADGSAIAWSLSDPVSAQNKKHGLLLIAQGSGCLPAIGNPSVNQAKLIAPDFSVLLVEKYGVNHRDKPKDPMKDCSADYFAHHTVSQRVDDVVQVIGELKKSNWWNGRLVILGGSEGGAVVARLTPLVQPDATVVFSSGLGLPLAQAIMQVIPPAVREEARQKLAEARDDPDSVEVFGGNSYRWWADVMDDVLINEPLKTHVPLLLVQGGRDQFAPVQSGRVSRDTYAAANRCELTYWEYPDYDHFMTDAAGKNHREEVFDRIAGWVGKTLSDGDTGCSNPIN